jgi:hypothetical protein
MKDYKLKQRNLRASHTLGSIALTVDKAQGFFFFWEGKAIFGKAITKQPAVEVHLSRWQGKFKSRSLATKKLPLSIAGRASLNLEGFLLREIDDAAEV